tara:strand:- start:59 stop:196 length:138 start_codon:yes stop_codon:yes gene_type:complete
MVIGLEIELEEVNYILSVLQKEPYKDVSVIIDKIKEQGDKQFSKK